jgi:hypothetical protein
MFYELEGKMKAKQNFTIRWRANFSTLYLQMYVRFELKDWIHNISVKSSQAKYFLEKVKSSL